MWTLKIICVAAQLACTGYTPLTYAISAADREGCLTLGDLYSRALHDKFPGRRFLIDCRPDAPWHPEVM